MPTVVIDEKQFSAEARQRLREPRCRGVFRPLDAARRQLGLLCGSDDRGQCRLYCLVDLDTRIVEDARFMAYGDLRSHPIADALTELMRDKPLDEALQIPGSSVDALLRGEEDSAFGEASDGACDFISSLQDELRAGVPDLKLLPKPVEKDVYKRKREADWTEFDHRWLPLSLLKKIGLVQTCLKQLISEKLKRSDINWSVEGLHDDFHIVIKISGVHDEEIPTLIRFMEEAVHEGIHPELSIEEYQA